MKGLSSDLLTSVSDLRKLNNKSSVQIANRSINSDYETFVKTSHGLHRKEVIQPHLPIRLPCYDFTPVANPTFGSVLTRLDY